MKKFVLLVIAIVAIAGFAHKVCHSTSASRELTDIGLANVEALADGEAIMQKCDTYCKYRSGYICWLQTNQGYKINCDEMVPWTFVP